MESRGLAQVESFLDHLVKQDTLTPAEKCKNMKNISIVTSYESFSGVHMVIENAEEKMEIKKKILQKVEPVLSDQAVFASHTSALSISELQSAAIHPERVCGIHIFEPVYKAPLWEIVQGGQSSDRCAATIFRTAEKLRKMSLMVKDSPGSLINRLLGVYLNEALLMALEGCDFQWIDSRLESFGMHVGPFRLMDEIGIDIADESSKILSRVSPNRMEPSILLKQVRRLGFPGKKTKKGFYHYRGHRQKSVNNAVLKILPGTRKENMDNIIQRTLYRTVNEAARCLEEKIAGSAERVDTAMIFGLGFPPFKGGLCKWADDIGLPSIADMLGKFQMRYGDRFSPANYVVNRKKFYGLE